MTDSELDKLLPRLPTYSERQLVNTLANARASNRISDKDRELLVSAIESQLRIRFPEAAEVHLGDKRSELTAKLQKLAAEVAALYPSTLLNNRLGSHVKTGGMKKQGWHYDSYVSYKPMVTRASLDIRQQESSDDPIVRVMLQETTGARTKLVERLFPLAEFDIAAKEYLDLIARLSTDAAA